MEIDLNDIVITGGNGAVASYVGFGTKVDRHDFDITDMGQVRDFLMKIKPKVIIHLAAETDMAKCEADPAHAYMVNTVGMYNLAFVAKQIGAKMVYISTDAIFPRADNPHGTGDVPNPKSVYGHSKYMGELAVKGLSDNYIIARTSWIFGGGKEKDKKFVGKFIPQLENTEAKAVNDQYNSPTYAKDLVEALKDLILSEKTGTFHVVNSGVASRYDMAQVLVQTLDKKTNILPVSASTFNVPAYQLSSGGLVGNASLRPWQEALVEYVKTEW